MNEELERRTIRKVAFRLLPLMVVLFFIAYVDRVNLSFAGPSLIKDLGLSSSLFGLASGIFFLSYFLFEVPSNLIMERVGARFWIARIMVTWGVVATATYLVTGPLSLLGMRFLLGIAEAGFFPGMILYLTYWFPAAYRSRVTAGFMIAIPVSVVLSAPISSAILALHGWHGLAGWQWLFILEGIPAILLGVVVLLVLRDGPNDAAWLTDEEKRWLTDRLETERAAIRRAGHMGLWDGLKNPAVLWLSLLYLLIVTSSYGLLFFMPQIIQTFSDSIMSTGLLNAIPYAAGFVAMLVWGFHSDRQGERRLHVAGACVVAAIGLAMAGYVGASGMALIGMVIAALGLYGVLPPFWAMPAPLLTGTAAAGGIALINSIANLGGYVGPQLIGVIKDATGSYGVGLYVLAGFALLGAVVALHIGRQLEQRAAAAAREPTAAVG